MTTKTDQFTQLSHDVVQAFDDLNGRHSGFRPAHAKGILLAGVFRPAAVARALTHAPHVMRPETPVSLRFSNFAGIPTIPDGHPEAAPRGLGLRFHLAEHVHTDLIAHSTNGFPARTPEEFLEFLRAAYASRTATERPSPIELFLGAHPAALAFVQTPKPFPASFVTESYFAVNAYAFTNAAGEQRFGRYRIRPVEKGSQYVSADVAAGKPEYLFDELKARLGGGPARMEIVVQVAEPGDVVDDSTVDWPEEREQIAFGTIELTSVVENNTDEQRHIIFDPVPRVDGIGVSGDPLTEPRADVYLLSGRRRRADGRK